MALLLVVSAVGLASVLGVALLASAALQAQATGNYAAGARAEALAESGLSLAAHWLLYPSKAPSRNAAGYWPGAANLSIPGAAGTLEVATALAGTDLYDVVATGRVPGREGAWVSRTARARLRVHAGLRVTRSCAMAGNTTTTAGVWLKNDVQCNGKLTNYGRVDGYVYAPVKPENKDGGTSGAWVVQTAQNKMGIPGSSTVRDYSTYVYQGRQYSAVTITASALSGVTLGPTADNPAGVFKHAGALTLGNDVTINGTLVNTAGQVNVNGTRVAITAAGGFPALVLHGDLNLMGPAFSRDLKVNGVTWMSGRVKSSSWTILGVLTFNGSVLFAGPTAFDGGFDGWVTVSYDPANVAVPDLDTSVTGPGVTVVSWGP